MIFGPCLVACSCVMHEGRRDQFDFLAGQLEVVGGWKAAGAASIRAAAAALSNAALRVNIGYLLDLRV